MSTYTSETLQKPKREFFYDFDGTLFPFITIEKTQLPSECAQLNQWSVPCFLAWEKPDSKKMQEKATAYGQFQQAFLDWAYSDKRTEDVPLNPDVDMVTQYDIMLQGILETSDKFYQTLKKTFPITMFSDALNQFPTNLIEKAFKTKDGQPFISDAYTTHLKDITWLLATFEIWERFGVTPNNLQKYAKFLSKHFKEEYLEQIAQALLDGDTVVINTFGVEEVSLEATRLALQNFIKRTGSEEEAKDFITIIDQAIEEGRLSTTGESYKEYLEIKKIADKISEKTAAEMTALKLITTVLKHPAENTKGKQEDPDVQEILNALSPEQLKQIQNYITSRTLPFDATGPIISTGVGKAIRVFEMHMPNTTDKIQETSAIGDSGTTDGPMIRMAQALNLQNVLWFPGTLSMSIPNNHDQANYSPLPQTEIVPKYTIEIKELNASDTNA